MKRECNRSVLALGANRLVFALFVLLASFIYGQDSTGTVIDTDGNVYKTIKIGNQWWMAENLKVTHYRNGDKILKETSRNKWSDLSSGAYCVYDNDESNAAIYGNLYNWYAVKDARNIAPQGWHVATDKEWKQLEMVLDMNGSEADDYGWRGTNQGSKMAGNASLWENGELKDDAEFGESGLSALSGGYRDCSNGYYRDMGFSALFWSFTEFNNDYAWIRYLNYTFSDISRNHNDKRYGFSVRCVRD